jgi:D-psicose/D-tagatose/L-ribulose 3-epimerase
MKFGVCINDDLIPLAAGAGYDYVELAVANSLRPEAEGIQHITALSKILYQSNIESETTNLMLPAGLRCVAMGVDESRLEKYFAAATERAAMVGAKVMVFGSGGQRNIPNSLAFAEGRQQFINALKIAGKYAAKHKVVIAVEPLNRSECNLINSVAQAVELVQEIDYGSVRVLSDLYHIQTETQSFSETTAAKGRLAHVHVAGRGRRAPIEDDYTILCEYFTSVKAAGYDQRISIEANWADFSVQAAVSLDVLQRAWTAA